MEFYGSRRVPGPVWRSAPPTQAFFEISPRYAAGLPFRTEDPAVAHRARIDERKAFLRCLRRQLGEEEWRRAKALQFVGVCWRWFLHGDEVVVDDATKHRLVFVSWGAYEGWAHYHRRQSARGRRRDLLVLPNEAPIGSSRPTSQPDGRPHLHLVRGRSDTSTR